MRHTAIRAEAPARRRPGIAFARHGLRIAGAAAIFWSISVYSYFRVERDAANTAGMVRRGEIFSLAAFNAMERELAEDSPSMRPSILSHGEIAALMLLERKMIASDAAVVDSEIAKFEQFSHRVLVKNPMDGFAWLALFWIDAVRDQALSDEALRHLRMSYAFAPNEGWIAEKRNPLVLRYFASLPSDVAELAVGEFVHLVRSFLYTKAAEILDAAPDEAKLLILRRLETLPDEQRRVFSEAIKERSGRGPSDQAGPEGRPWR